MTGENEFPAEDDQSVGGTGEHVQETRALGAHHEEREERDARERDAGLAAATPLQVRAAEHQLGGQQGATMDHQVSGMWIFQLETGQMGGGAVVSRPARSNRDAHRRRLPLASPT